MATNNTKRAAGFYMTIFAALLCLASAIAYVVCFRGMTYTHGSLYSQEAVIGLCAAAALSVALLFVKLEGYAPVLLCAASGLSFLVYVYKMVWPIADIFTAIDPVAFVPQLITCGALLVVSFLFSEIALYMRKRKAT